MADSGNADNEVKPVTFDDLELKDPADHPREQVRIRERGSGRRWNMDKRPKKEAPPGVSPQVEANLTAMAGVLKQLSEEIVQLRQEANIATAKADTAIRDATEAAQKTVVAQLQGINDSIDKAVQSRGEQIAQMLIDRIAGAQSQSQTQPPAQPTPLAVPANGPAPSAGNWFEAIMAKAAMQEMGLGQQNQFGQLIQLSQAFGQVYGAFMQPLAQLEDQIAKRLMNQMVTIDRTGGNVPWQPQAQPTAKATLSQAADILAARCKLR